MSNPISIEDIVQKWQEKLSKILLFFYITSGIFGIALIFINLFVQNAILHVASGFFILFFLGLFFVFQRRSRLLAQRWVQDFMLPTQRLLQTINMVSSQKLDLLPEEQSNSYTSDSHVRLLEVARGILEHQRFVDKVVDNMFEMMFLLNQDGIITKANKSACDTTRYSQNELIGQHIRKLFPHAEGLVDYYLELEIQFTTHGQLKDMEVFVQTAEGELLPFSINGVKIESSNGSFLGYTIIAKNQTETVRLINQLNKSNFNLGQANDELGKRYDQIKKEIEAKEGQRKTLELELATSQLVQKTFLPQVAPVHPSIECAGTVHPAVFCGGDWWNTVSLANKFYVFIADVTGHGTASAMVTAAVSGYFISIRDKLQGGEHIDVDAILSGFDKVLTSMGNNEVRYHMTCFACVFNFEQKTLRFANAGHNFPILVRENKKMEPLAIGGDRLGNSDGQPFEIKELPLEGGEMILFYTDGLIENKNEKGEGYGKRRLRKFIETHHTQRCSDFVMTLLEESLRFCGEEKALEDDMTIVATKVKRFVTQ